MKTKIIEVTLHRVEGKNEEASFSSLEEANKRLLNWGWDVPKGGCYDKVDFTVHFEDGEKYGGRFDMVYGGRDTSGDDLKSHILCFLEFVAGRRQPYHMKDEVYQKLMEHYKGEHQSTAIRMLDTYDWEG